MKLLDSIFVPFSNFESLVYLICIIIGGIIFILFMVLQYTHNYLPLHQLDPLLFWMVLFLVAFCSIQLKLNSIALELKRLRKNE